jgi:hypothetical protein
MLAKTNTLAYLAKTWMCLNENVLCDLFVPAGHWKKHFSSFSLWQSVQVDDADALKRKIKSAQNLIFSLSILPQKLLICGRKVFPYSSVF